MKRQIDVICFSGTGNTELVTEKIVDILRENDIDVNEKSTKEKYVHTKGNELLLAFPANSQAVSPYIWKFFKALPDGNGDKAHIVVTLNESVVILKPLKKLLIKKGYLPQDSVEISMPSNLLTGEDTTFGRLQDGLISAEAFAKDLADDKAIWSEEKKGSAFVSFLSRKTSLLWVSMRMINKLEVDTNKCIKCGLCVKECPVGNIRMDDFPTHLNNCQFCMRCGAFCKNGAVVVKGKPNFKIRCSKQIENENNN